MCFAFRRQVTQKPLSGFKQHMGWFEPVHLIGIKRQGMQHQNAGKHQAEQRGNLACE